MKLFKMTKATAQYLSHSAQVRLALVSGSALGMILAAGAGSQWN
jgi:hypothetical protein